MRHYELVVVLSPILSEEDTSSTWDRIKQLITQSSAEITEEEQWGMRRLAYPIRRAGQTFLEGNYILTRFSTETVVPRELESQLRLGESILRFLLVRSDGTKAVPPSPMMPGAVRPAQPRVEPAVAEVAAGSAVAETVEEPAVAEVVEEPVVAEAAEEPAVAEVAAESAVAEAVEEPAVAEAVEEPVVAEEPAVAEAEEPVLVEDEEAGPEPSDAEDVLEREEEE